MRLSMRYRIVVGIFFLQECQDYDRVKKEHNECIKKKDWCVSITSDGEMRFRFIYSTTMKFIACFYLSPRKQRITNVSSRCLFFFVVNICCETSQFMLFFIGELRYGRVHAACPKFIIFTFPSFAYLTA